MQGFQWVMREGHSAVNVSISMLQFPCVTFAMVHILLFKFARFFINSVNSNSKLLRG